MSLDKSLVLEHIENLLSNPLARSFMRVLYHEVPVDALRSVSERNLAEAIESTYKLLSATPSYSKRAEITKLGKDQDVAVVEVVARYAPFLVESISNELKRSGATIHLIVHPSLDVKRAASGEVTSCCNVASCTQEAVMQFFITNQFSDDYYLALKTKLHTIIECVDLAVQDWKFMQQRMRDAIKNLSSKSWYQSPEPMEEEAAQFLEWLLDNHFVFLGSSVISYEPEGVEIDDDNRLGLAKAQMYRDEMTDIGQQIAEIVFVKRSKKVSVVHRDSHMNCIYIKQFDKKGSCNSVIAFLGFLTSSVYRESVKSIPIIRTKVQNVLTKYGYNEQSYNTKELVDILESFSRTDLIQINEDNLFEIATGMISLNLMPRVKLFLHKDIASQFVHCFVFIPKAKFRAEVMGIVEKILSKQIGGSVSRYYIHAGESQIVRIQISVKSDKALKKEYNVARMEDLIAEAISVWLDEFSAALHVKYSKQVAAEKYNKFKGVFDAKYTSFFAAKQAVHDTQMLEAVIAEKRVKFDLYLSPKSSQNFLHLKIFSYNKELPLSETLSTLEDMAFSVIDTLTFRVPVAPQDSTESNEHVFIHYFRLKYKYPSSDKFTAAFKRNIEQTLEKIWDGSVENDKFNGLIVCANITWQESVLLRGLAAYLRQLGFFYDKNVIIESFIENPLIAKKLVQLFYAKFAPNAKNARAVEVQECALLIESLLVNVLNLGAEKIFRAYVELIFATKRTNFFARADALFEINGLSFKIASSEVQYVPLPKPFMEIFVYSSRFEAIHLRGGKIARGGLRWSDRKEDFRTEVLGLMKAQMTKNSVIVPDGAKGGFVLKSVFSDSAELKKEGVACYQNFIRAILDVTDNVIDGRVVTPVGVVRYDDEDPYLVVAADKGTAMFSDYANAVAKEYTFWLDDAFASGGSSGYDHKKMAITARGAWISAQEHCSQFSLDVMSQPFTVVGIGDMSGDVFGNGLLLSKQCKLIAAFNHLHIFIDPNPDLAASFAERKRLFDLPYSKWSDYNQGSISRGGGVFARNVKSIVLSEEAVLALGVMQNTFAPEELIKAILKAPVDLLWNGGIGTYVKAASESDAEIGDKSNDAVRVYGKDLRCRVVAEGGNLGLTQLGRIEYARNNGRINTDFIDNSAGVDCSDHEVNIKIALADLVSSRALSLKQRDEVLVQMTEEVAQLVLKDNHSQILLTSLEQRRGKKRIAEHFWLMRNLERNGKLNRELEKLPSHEDLAKIEVNYGCLTRPEIAVLISYAKNAAVAAVMSSTRPLDRALEDYLVNYFPKVLQERYRAALLQHKLRNEIIVTCAVNAFVHYLGCCLFHYLLEHGYEAVDILHAFYIATHIMNCDAVWLDISALSIDTESKMKLFSSVTTILEKVLLWLLNNKSHFADIAGFCVQLKGSIAVLSVNEAEEATSKEEERSGVPQILRNALHQMQFASEMLDVIQIANKTSIALEEVIACYSALKESLHFGKLEQAVAAIDLYDYSNSSALSAVSHELVELLNFLVIRVLTQTQSANFERLAAVYRNFVVELLRSLNAGNAVAKVVLASRKLQEFIHEL